MRLEEVNIYRMTHINNIPHILECGITHRNSKNSNVNFVNIGDTSLINTRNAKIVIINNGNLLGYGAPSIILGDFIPFYFGKKTPMLYVMQNGGNFVEKATNPKNIIYLRCSVSEVIKQQQEFYFTDGHATDHLSSFYDRTKINDLVNIIDWHAVNAPFWSGDENLNVKRKKQSEFLVRSDISPNLVNGFGCYNEPSKQDLIAMGVEEHKIRIIPNEYY